MDRATFQPGPLSEVDIAPSGDRWTLIAVRQLRHAPEKVWAALTDPAQLAEWSPFTANRDLGSPGAAILTMLDGDVPEDTTAEVVRAEPPTLLEYSWGGDRLRWELTPSGTGTRLTLRHTASERDDLAKFAAGWHLCLDVAEHLLDGRPIGPIRGDEATKFGFDKLHDAYAERLNRRGRV